MTTLWDPIRLGHRVLSNRLVQAPMTRSRARHDGTPGELAPAYYAQRASMGLLITEGTQPSADGQGYANTPGLHEAAHVAGWRLVTEAVHAAGGRLFIQLMHAGRMSHPDNTPHHRQALAPSAIAANVQIPTVSGMRDVPVPRAMTPADIRRAIEDFAVAAERAVEAGADGVEIHGANGYLVQQFLAPNANVRTDAYGGSIENRVRFALEVAAAVADRIGAARTGLRLSPGSVLGGIDEGPESADLYRHLVTQLAPLGLAYLHVVQGRDEALLQQIRRLWPSVLIVNRPGRDRQSLASDLDAGLADMVSVGRMALSNPDLPVRIREDLALNEPDPATFYGGGEKGYTDYPVFQAA
ncbi:alkene reductase [Castellaniella daejeonensis]|jgi:2,4-dienoyl-CoA reductase-like NADH-dependent reductase (Old Yellow Enzyme family)|uniref:Alkene reductase n=1 Tax=Castellaniella daejeonensis TaxID=659013 RepID=A0ABN0TUB4_9BURK